MDLNLSCLLSLLREQPAYARLLAALEAGGASTRVVSPDCALAPALAALSLDRAAPLLAVAPEAEAARRLRDELESWAPAGTPVLLFPELEGAGEDEFDREAHFDRLRALSALAGSGPPVIVALSAAALVSPASPRELFAQESLTLRPNLLMDPVGLMQRLQEMGYENETTVEVPGTAGKRGGIVDIYSPQADRPVRLEFLANILETIRPFDPRSQRSEAPVEEAVIVPAGRGKAAGGSILDYLPGQGLLAVNDPEAARDALGERWPEMEKLLGSRRHLVISEWGDENLPRLPFTSVGSYGGRLDEWVKALKPLVKDGPRVIIVSHQARRLSEVLADDDIPAAPLKLLCGPPEVGSLTLLEGSLAEGWAIPGSAILFSDKEIFGFVKQRRQSARRPVHWRQFLAQLSPGDYVVHIDHGIGRFTGMSRQVQDGVEREYLVLEYDAGDTLSVPVERIDRVTRYVGADENPPGLNRLGTQEWSKKRSRVKKAAEDIARELLQLYAAREAAAGHACGPDTLWQQEMEAAFPYVETADQLEAVRAVKEEMEKPRPMDRLICGDVGYGKTEVALRAAFKAVMDGKQVAILVPTTILAQQHYLTFRERLQAYPVKVGMLSRFVPDREQQKALEALAAGNLDIVIGTHRLLQKDVVFKDLGLVVIDEEQRFGVSHKEKLKKMRAAVDVLSLSATPIPRTLYMGLVGVRDMSVIETPPEERLPIKTHVGQYDEAAIALAIGREIERGGQAFVVHNRVQTIGGIALKLGQLVPGARFAVAHGQMPEDQLEKIMSGFAAGESDVLVSTTIIESGLDMPRVNTLIVTDAERLGLTQLHQLRGRVGRGVERAYAYFFYPRDKQLTLQARRRLKAIFEHTELGAGFGIAMRDLEIRGAGNLLGAEQSGHIADVGFDLYCRLLGEAVAELKARGAVDTISQPQTLPPADLPLSAFIPDRYVPEEDVRISLYYRLTALNRRETVAEMRKELADRFGPPPKPVENILYVMELRLLAKEAGAESIKWDHEHVVVQLGRERQGQPVSVNAVRYRGRLRVGTGQVRLEVRGMGEAWMPMLRELLGELAAPFTPSGAGPRKPPAGSGPGR
jgi:transcription-repair coupling factor (superfamily II helicase)